MLPLFIYQFDKEFQPFDLVSIHLQYHVARAKSLVPGPLKLRNIGHGHSTGIQAYTVG